MNNRVRALAVLIAVFLLGGFLGAGGTYWKMKKSAGFERGAMQGRRPSPPMQRQRMQDPLRLTPEQNAQFGKIMEESRRQMDALRAVHQPKLDAIFAEQQPKINAIFAEQQPKMDAIIADTNRKVMAILNKDQQQKFESMLKEMNNRARRPSRGGRGMMSPPPQR